MVAKIMIDDNDSKLVSVVIPFFNRERCLSRAIDSVISQTYENWEIILVDDGSTDNSSKIAEDYSRMYPGKIRIFNQENKGHGPARNKAITEARGAFIAILDSDDQWNNNFLKRTIDAFEFYTDVDWVYVNAKRITEDGSVIEPSIFDGSNSSDFRNLKILKVEHLNIIDDANFLVAAIASTVKAGANSVVRREVFKKVLYPSIRVGADRVVIISAIAAGFRFGFIDEILLTLYHHSNNNSIAARNDMHKNIMIRQEMVKVYEYVNRQVDLDKSSKAVLRKRLSDVYFDYASILLESRRSYMKMAIFLFKSIVVYPKKNPLFRKVRNKFIKLFNL